MPKKSNSSFEFLEFEQKSTSSQGLKRESNEDDSIVGKKLKPNSIQLDGDSSTDAHQNRQNGVIMEMLQGLDYRMTKLENTIQSFVAKSSTESGVQHRMIKENLTLTRKIFKETTEVLGESCEESEDETEVAHLFPLQTVEEVDSMEEKLQNEKFFEKTQNYITSFRFQTPHEAVRQIFADKCLREFNWDGRINKRSLKDLKLIQTVLLENFLHLGRLEYTKQMRKAIELSHNRYKQHRYTESKTNVFYDLQK